MLSGSMSGSLTVTLEAICDAFLPSMDADFVDSMIQNKHVVQTFDSEESRAAAIRELCTKSASDVGIAPAVVDKLKFLPRDAYNELVLLLTAMGTTPGNLLITGYAQPFHTLNKQQREKAMLTLASAQIPQLRKAFRAFKGLATSTYMNMPRNPNWKAVGYSGPEVDSINKQPYKHGYSMLPITGETEMDFDIVIVGSGCGGGVMAAELSKAGLRVVVVEKGSFIKSEDMNQLEGEAFDEMYERGGTVTTEDGAITILAGASFGGGTAVNWSCCLPTPGFVRDEWAAMGLKKFVSGDFQRSLEHVTKRIGVHEDNIDLNGNNQTMFDGCKALGYDVQMAPQNLQDASNDSGAGFISIGDRYGNKQSTPVTFMEDAASHGCQFIDKCYVERITQDSKGQATGVEATVDGNKSLKLHSRAVIVAAGSLHSPALLMRSKVANKNIGLNLRLHPVTGVWGVMNEREGPVDFWRGPPMTTVSNVGVGGAKGDNYGYKLECPSVHPGLGAAVLPWDSTAQFREKMTQMSRMALLMVLVRDSGSGKVVLDKAGQPRVHYAMNAHDKGSMKDGVDKMLRIAVAAGANEVGTLQQSVGSYKVSPESKATSSLAETSFLRYCDRVQKKGVEANDCGLFSAHQMGTCRMGISADTSVVDPEGQSWEVPNLYVADASTFPTPSGANPMMTTLGISHMIAQGIKTKLGQKLLLAQELKPVLVAKARL